MDKKSKSTPSKTNFHFKDKFFEEILNGIPQEDFDYDDKKNSSVVLSTDNKTRFNRVVKEILSSEESKQIFINLIKNAKKREQAKFSKKLDLFFLKEDKEEEDKNEDDEEIEEIGEKEDKQNILSKVLDAKRKYDKLKKLSRKKDNFLKLINQIRSVYFALSAVSVAGTLAVRNKTLREMHGYMDPFLNNNFMPFMIDVVYPSITTSMLNLAMDTTDKLKEIIKSVYDGFRDFAAEIIKTIFTLMTLGKGKALYLAGQALAGVAEVADNTGENFEKRVYKILRRALPRELKIAAYILEYGYKGIKTYVDNPDLFKNAASTFFILFGSLDENARAKIDLKLQEKVKKINTKGEEIIKKIRHPSDTTIDLVDMTKDFTDIGIDLYNTGKDYVGDELNNFETNIQNIIDDKSSTQDKFELTYRLMANSYFGYVELSPWSRAARLIGGIVKKTSRLFGNLHDRLKESNEIHEGIYYSNGKIANLEDYFDGIAKKVREKRSEPEKDKGNIKGYINYIVSTKQSIHENIGKNTKFYYYPYVRFDFLKRDKMGKRKFTSRFYERNNNGMTLLDEIVTKDATRYELDKESRIIEVIVNDPQVESYSYRIDVIRSEKFEKAINRPTMSKSSVFFDFLFIKHVKDFNKESKDFLKDIRFLNINNNDFEIKENDNYYNFLKLDEEFFKKMKLSTDFESAGGFYNTVLMTESYVHQMKTHLYSKICNILEIIDGDKPIAEKYELYKSKFPINHEFQSSSKT